MTITPKHREASSLSWSYVVGFTTTHTTSAYHH